MYIQQNIYSTKIYQPEYSQNKGASELDSLFACEGESL